MTKPPVPLEAAVQRGIVDALRALYTGTVFAVPNGAKRTRWQQQQAKRDGVRAGVPDIGIVYPGGTAWLEVKRPGYTASAVSEPQRELHGLWRGWGHQVAIATSIDEAVRLFDVWGVPRRSKPAPGPMLQAISRGSIHADFAEILS